MSAGCSNPYPVIAKFTYAQSKMGVWFIFRGDPRKGDSIAEAGTEAAAKMIVEALNQTQ